jgi:hypothetical protein
MLELRALAVLAATVIAGCSLSPVSATRCAVERSPRGGLQLRATIDNRSSKALHYAGVIVTGGSAFAEFEFHPRLGPWQARDGLVGTSLEPQPAHPPGIGAVPEADCWARITEYDDGSNWSTSPL